MVHHPRVSVVMSVYNGERYLREAVESILGQTFMDYEFIIVDDGSTDGTWEILTRCNDPRIRLIRNTKNIGLTRSLNKGFKLVRGEYIARMDADDVSLPERLAKQVHYMEAHPEIGVIGTWIEYIDENGTSRGKWQMPSSSGLIGWFLLFGNCLAHPSVMMRRDVVERVGFYRSEALFAQDYDLWIRASAVTRIANIPDILLLRRVVPNSICSRHRKIQEQNVVKGMHILITRLLGSEVSYETVESLRKTVTSLPLANLEQIEMTVDLIKHLHQIYLKKHSLSRMETKNITRDAGSRLYTLAISASEISFWKGFNVYIEALKLNPQLLSLRTIKKVISRLIGRT